MKARRKRIDQDEDDDMRPEYDFSNGVRGKYAARFPPDTIAVVLAPDVAEYFRTDVAVNRALRSLLPIKRAHRGSRSARRRRR